MKTICLIGDRNIYIKRLSGFLTEQGFNVHLVCRNFDGLGTEQFSEKIIFHQLNNSRLISKFFQIKNIFKKIKPDYVHIHQLHRDTIIPALFPLRKYKLYVTIWGSDVNINSNNKITRIIQNLALLFSDKIHLLSDYFVRTVKSKYSFINPAKLEVFSWGIDYLFFNNPDLQIVNRLKVELEITHNTRICLSYRNHKELYNHHTTIKAIPFVLEKFPNTKFIFTRGSCNRDYVNKSVALAEKLGIEKNFLFLDKWLTEEEISALLNISDISISISKYDGLPATLFEMMSSDTIPIISSLINYKPYFKEGENGFYLQKINDAKELANTIIKILNKPSTCFAGIVKNNNQFVNKTLNWNTQKNYLLNLYKENN